LYLSFGSSVSYYVTVSEFLERSEELSDSNVRIAGTIADTPVLWDAENLILEFMVTESSDSLDVFYQGARPSGFKAGADILVEGKLHSDGLFHATQLIMKCPSKYVPDEWPTDD
jgi:cytochrome c-type biogenesis protein CcmE